MCINPMGELCWEHGCGSQVNTTFVLPAVPRLPLGAEPRSEHPPILGLLKRGYIDVISLIWWIHCWCMHLLVLCLNQDFTCLLYLFYTLSTNTHFKFDYDVIQIWWKFLCHTVCYFSSLTHFADSSTNPQSTHTLTFSQEETNDIVLVEKYWHPGHALFIVYFGHWKHEQ